VIERKESEWRPVAALSAIWIALVLVVDPRGDFPMLDDWSYGRSVKHLVEYGELRYDGWNAPTLFLQVLYGALFALPLGFSFEVLRLSTLVAGLAGGIGTYLLLREAAATRLVAVAGSLALMLNPSYFQHSLTFMTDVPFTALVVWSSLFFLRALRTGSLRSTVMGTVLAACATLVRQPGIMIPVAFGIAALATNPLNARLHIRSTLAALAVTSTYVSYFAAIRYLRMEPVLLGSFQGKIRLFVQRPELLTGIAWLLNRARILLTELSLMNLPALLVLGGFAANRKWRATQLLAVLLVATALTIVLTIGIGAVDLPYKVFSPVALLMAGQADWGYVDEHYRLRPTLLRLQFAAVWLMTFLIVARAVVGPSTPPLGHSSTFDRAGSIFGFSAAALLIAPFLFSHLFERYLIPPLPLFMVALACLIRPPRTTLTRTWQGTVAAIAALVLIGFGTLSVLFAHDSLLWNRMRWEAVDVLVNDKQIDPATIDGGLSVNGWFLFPVEGPLRQRYANSPSERAHWWRNDGAEYIIAMTTPRRLERLLASAHQTPDERIEVVWRRPFTGWLPGSSGEVLVCRGRLCNEVFKKK
jgi:hypothetical protein